MQVSVHFSKIQFNKAHTWWYLAVWLSLAAAAAAYFLKQVDLSHEVTDFVFVLYVFGKLSQLEDQLER